MKQFIGAPPEPPALPPTLSATIEFDTNTWQFRFVPQPGIPLHVLVDALDFVRINIQLKRMGLGAPPPPRRSASGLVMPDGSPAPVDPVQ
jgi:hypothetical protein